MGFIAFLILGLIAGAIAKLIMLAVAYPFRRKR